MAMPDRTSTEPLLVAEVELATKAVQQARYLAAPAAEMLQRQAAAAVTLLALARAEWDREAAFQALKARA